MVSSGIWRGSSCLGNPVEEEHFLNEKILQFFIPFNTTHILGNHLSIYEGELLNQIIRCWQIKHAPAIYE